MSNPTNSRPATKIRQATVADADLLAALLADYLHESYPGHLGSTAEQLRRDVLGDRRRHTVLLASVGDVTVGFVASPNAYRARPQSPVETMKKLNAAWHSKNRMPANATMAQRIAWHREHSKHCACRPIPKTVQTAMRRSGARPRAD